VRAEKFRATPRIRKRFYRSELAFLWRQTERLVPLFAQHTQNLFAPITRQYVGKKSPIADDDAKRAHELLRGRKAMI
jgi:hypothetical protein